jgi:hypothetical protein
MRKVIFGVGVALLTFMLGAIVYYLTTLKPAAQPAAFSKPAEVRYEHKLEVRPSPVPVNVSIILTSSSLDRDTTVFSHRTLKLSDKTVVVDDLDIDEDVDGQEMKILGGDKSTQFRISERYRTSMTVMGEGPHLDLVNWLHYDSEWIPMKQLDQRRFRTLTGEQMDSEKFPATTKADLMAAVRKAAGDWTEAIELAQSCKGPTDNPCSVGVSSVYFRVEVLSGDQWITVGLVEVPIPMGC